MHEKGFYEMRLTMEFPAGVKKIKTFLKKLLFFFKKAVIFFLKALDLLKKRPVTNDRKNIKTGCTNHLIQPVFIFIRLYTTD